MPEVKQEVLVDVELSGKLLDVVERAILLGKQQLLLELAELVEADDAHSYRKAWRTLDLKYRVTNSATEACEGCGNAVARHESGITTGGPGSVRCSIKEDGSVCCSHLKPKAATI